MMRQFYNDTVLTYNNKVQTIPSNIVAKLCHFKEEEYFKADEKRKRSTKKYHLSKDLLKASLF